MSSNLRSELRLRLECYSTGEASDHDVQVSQNAGGIQEINVT